MKPFDLSKLRKNITKNIEGVSFGFTNPTVWFSTGCYTLNWLLTKDFKKGFPLDGKINMLAGDLEKKFNIVGYVEPSENHIYADSKIIGYPKIKGLLGPMWDGDRVRYEDQSTYDALSI